MNRDALYTSGRAVIVLRLFMNDDSRRDRFPFGLAKLIAVGCLLSAYPLAGIIPYEMTWENGPIENFQVLLLLAGALINWRLYKNSAGTVKMYLWQAVFFAVLTARELSWGRVFFSVSVGEDGPVFLEPTPNQKLILHGIVGLLIIWLLVNLIRWVPWKRLLRRGRELPWCFLSVIFASVFLAYIGEKGLYGLGHKVGQSLEELSEANVYFCLCCLSAWYNVHFCQDRER